MPDELLEGVDWKDTFRRLVLYAHRKLGHQVPLAEAEDMAGEALRQFLDPEYADWDPARQTLPMKLGSIVNGLFQNRTRIKRTDNEIGHDFTSPTATLPTTSPELGPDARALSRAEGRRALTLLEEELKGHDHAESVFLLECDGVSDCKEQAAALCLPIGTVYKARHRLGQAREAVRQRMQGEG